MQNPLKNKDITLNPDSSPIVTKPDLILLENFY